MNYHCEICDYNTNIKYCYNKHLDTKKHKNNIIINDNLIIEKNKNFICDKCNKQLKSKQNLEYHKTCCRGIYSLLECCKCNKKFNKSITRYVHEKKCIKLENNNNNNNNNNKSYVTNNNNYNITNIGTQNNNTINIAVNNFGNEKFDYFLEHPDFVQFMNNCIENKVDGICNLIVKKHFDPEHPENHNIRKMNKKDNFLEIYKDNNWNTKNYKDGLDYITIPLEMTFSIFMEKMIEHNQIIKTNVIQHFMKEVGSILTWDLSAGDYNFSFNNNDMHSDMSDKSKNMLKLKIYKVFCECLYKYSKIIHQK